MKVHVKVHDLRTQVDMERDSLVGGRPEHEKTGGSATRTSSRLQILQTLLLTGDRIANPVSCQARDPSKIIQ